MSPERLSDLRLWLLERIDEPLGNIVSSKRLSKLDEARDYDAASSYNYLFAELMTIKHAVARGRTIKIDTNPLITLGSIDQFMDWALDRYPGFAAGGYHDLTVDPIDVVRC